MSLQKKLYLGFFIMIVLVVFTGTMAIWDFWKTGGLVGDTHLQISNISELFVPANQLVTQIYTDVNQASLFFHAYSFNRLPADYDEGIKNLEQIQNRIGKIGDLMQSPRAAMLAQAQNDIQRSRDGLEAIAFQARNLHSSMQRIDELQEQINVDLAKVNELLNSLYDDVIADISAQFADETAVGMTPARERTLKSWNTLDGIYNATTAAEVQFWQGRGKYGEEAAAVFRNVETRLTEQGRQVKTFLDAGLVTDSKAREKYESLSGALTKYARLIKDFSDEWSRSTEINAVVAQSSQGLLDAFDQLDMLTSDLSAASADKANKSADVVDVLLKRSTLGSLITLAATIVIGGLLAFFITRSIVKPVKAVITSLSRGDKVIGEAALRITTAAHDLAAGVTEQVSSLEATSSALEQVSAMAKTSAESAKGTSNSAAETSGLVKGGVAGMEEMSTAMSKINDQADKISNIIKTIEEIAFQTNLLALNAAVEAARAGEAGKGFAVVADEVRNLSGRSAQAAKDTADLITETVESVRSGSSILTRLSGSYGAIEGGIVGISGLIGQIASASEEQSLGVEQIQTAVSKINDITQQNADGAKESAVAARNLEEQITDLRDNIMTLQEIVSGRRILYDDDAPAAVRTEDKHAVAPPSRQLAGSVA